MGKIYYVMGKSASGKDRIYSRLAGDKNLKSCLLKYALNHSSSKYAKAALPIDEQ